MNKKILVVLAAMCLIPIARSCDVTVGYPLPVVEGISLSNPINDLIENYQPVRSTAFLFVNLAALLLLGRFLLKKIRPGRGLVSLYDAVLFISFIQWSGWLMCYVPDPPEGTLFYKTAEAFWFFIGIFATAVPNWLSSEVFNSWLDWKQRDIILYRAWFTFATVALVFIFYGLRRLTDLRRRASSRP